MSKTISMKDCRDLRKVINILTQTPVITKVEYARLLMVIDDILERLDNEKDAP